MKGRRLAWFSTALMLTVCTSVSAQSPAASAPSTPASAERLATQVCATCHGPKGESRISPAFPRLAGQQADYIESQLKAFRDRSRGDPMAQAFMWGMASQLSDDVITQLAAYFAAQKPVKSAAAAPKLVATGRTIFTEGIPAANVVPCMSCHGQHAEGNASIPRLAGQHVEYLVKQLGLFKSEMRADAAAAIMHVNVAGMTLEQMEAVAAYESAQ